MDHRRQKQIIIGLVSSVAILGVVLLFVALTGNGGLRSIEEYSEDRATSTPNFRALEVVFAEFFEVSGRSTYDAVAYINNPNIEYGASTAKYEFSFYGKNGELLHRVLGKTFILPGESKYVVVSAIEISAIRGLSVPENVDFNIKEVSWQRLEPFSPVGLRLRDTVLVKETEAQRTRFSGIASNASPYNFKNVEVYAVAYRSGRPFAAGKTNMQDLTRGSERAFQIIWSSILPDDTTIDARVESNFFENSNFIKDYDISP